MNSVAEFRDNVDGISKVCVRERLSMVRIDDLASDHHPALLWRSGDQRERQ